INRIWIKFRSKRGARVAAATKVACSWRTTVEQAKVLRQRLLGAFLGLSSVAPSDDWAQVRLVVSFTMAGSVRMGLRRRALPARRTISTAWPSLHSSGETNVHAASGHLAARRHASG